MIHLSDRNLACMDLQWDNLGGSPIRTFSDCDGSNIISHSVVIIKNHTLKKQQ